MSFSIPTYGPSSPFFTGAFSDPRTIPYTVNLDGRDYPIDLTQYRHNGVARFRNGMVTSDEVNDALLNPEGAWWRYRFSWHLGAGQEIDELDPKADPARFQASAGINVWDKYQACLLPATETVNKSLTASDIHMVATDTYLYVSDGTSLQRSADPELGASATWTTITGLSGTITGLTTDGSSVYVSTTVEVFEVASGTAASAFSTSAQPGLKIAVAANRLILADDNVIGEESTTSFTAIYTHFQSAFRWTCIFSVGSRVYLGGYAGNRSELYTVTTDDTGALVLSSEAASFFSGELLYDAIGYAGSVILATSKGIRFATLGADGTLQYGPLIDDFGAAYCLAAEGRFVWAGVENHPVPGTGLVRLALDTFTDTLLPAYASDIYTEANTGDIEAIARFNGRTYFAVSADEVYGEDPNGYVTSGYIDSGDLTFGTVEDKSVSELRAQYDALAANETITVALTDGSGSSIGSKTDPVDGSDELQLDVVGNNLSRARVRVTLTGDGTTTPCMKQWRLRGYPVAPGVEEWLVPLIIKSKVVVNDSEGQLLSLNPWNETAHIRDLWQEQEIVLYKEGNYSFRVRVDNFQIDAVDWRDGSDWFETMCTVRLLST